MIIQTNIQALNSKNNLKRNNSKLMKNLEKLSSGYAINRSGDDAAGLAISEQMRTLLAGLDQAEANTEDGINLIMTGEGALQEVHSMLQRLKTLSLQSSNGTYENSPDRQAMQEELRQLCEEIDRIGHNTSFNDVHLFQNEGFSAENIAAPKPNIPTEEHTSFSADMDLENEGLKDVIYEETTYEFSVTQTPEGSQNNFAGNELTIANTLKEEIVPQVVTAIMEKYTAFSYLSGSEIGIGLNLYSDSNSSVLASVGLGLSCTQNSGGLTCDTMTYTLNVNIAQVGDLTNPDNRSALEQTIAHEMMHAFMDEATTVGMTGMSPSGQSEAYKFPGWFVEGMAQTASGPGNWIWGSTLNLNESSTTDEITAALTQSTTKLGSGGTGSEYGTGYLACMYLGYLAYETSNNAAIDMTDSDAAAEALAEGLSKVLSGLIEGKSLQTVIDDITDGQYTTIESFQNGFAHDSDALAFVQELLQYTAVDADNNGNVGGGVLSGDLSGDDPVADGSISDLKLFELNTDYTTVENKYPSEITVLSGGGAKIDGVSPIASSTSASYPQDIFTVTGSGLTENTDWSFDTATGTLYILSDRDMTITGGTLTDANGTHYGNIVIQDGVNANITLDGVKIDTTLKTGNIAGIEIGDNSNVTIKVTGTNTIIGSGTAAGIQLSDDNDTDGRTSVTIDIAAGGSLDVRGDLSKIYSGGGAAIGAADRTGAGASDIIIQGSGTLSAKGAGGGAAIGASDGGDIGDITISGSGLTVTAVGGEHGAGIGGSWYSAVDDILITGDVDIDASSKDHATGIGGGCHGTVNTITIGDSNSANDDIKITSQGGDYGAGIGAGWAGEIEKITINGGTIEATAGDNGAGIGGGYLAEVNEIEINGGTITAKGSTNSSGIGGGMHGTVAGITISGGMITADGGWTDDGGNIGGYTDSSGTNKTQVLMTNPSGLTIKAGTEGEGKYITTGTVDSNGNALYVLDMSYIGMLLADGNSNVNVTVPGTTQSRLDYSLNSVKVKTKSGLTYNWSDLQHMTEDSAYIWMKGEDITLEFEDRDGTKGSVDLKFFEDYGLWRVDETELAGVPIPNEPTYVTTQSSWPPPTLDGGNPGGDINSDHGSIILQIGPSAEETFRIPRFYFAEILDGLNKLNVSTQRMAQDSVGVTDAIIDRVSEMRGTYGALQNALEHTINKLNVNIENITAAESRIRDTDMAREITEYTKNNIILQAAQAMLTQANAMPQNVLNMLQ